MGRKKLYANTSVALLSQVLTIICGFILPRYMLTAYGSTVNGLVSSISQFLGVISFMQLGVGAVVQSALYEPLAKNDNKTISEIYCSAAKFFRLIALIFSGYVVILFCIYPRVFATQFDFWFSGSLILILSVSLFAQYYFGLTNQLLLYADQKAYIPLVVDVFSLIINTILAIVLITLGKSVHMVKLGSSLVYIMRPLILSAYVNRHYLIDKHAKYSTEPIKQKWNGLTQHVASTVMDNTDVLILTMFSTLENVSIYNIYNLIVFGVRQLVASVTVGLQSYFGNLYVKYEKEHVKKVFNNVEIIFHTLITILFTCVLLLIVPFVTVYTSGVNDVDYYVPLFAVIISLAQAFYCFRLIYYIMIKAAGHFKQTQQSAIIEMVINLLLSVVCVARFGLIGVAIGTLAATLYRTIYFILYLNRNILYINLRTTIIRFVTDAVSISLSFFFLSGLSMDTVSYVGWFFLAIKVTLLVFGITVICALVEVRLAEKEKWNSLVVFIQERCHRS